MKLFKKLLPVATIGSVAAIVTPLVTSCSKKTYYNLDSDSLYIPDVARAVADDEHPSGYNPTDAKKLYYDNIAKKPEILFEDIASSTSFSLYNYAHVEKRFESYKIQENFSNLHIDTENDLLSFSVEGQYHIKQYAYADKVKVDIDLSVKMNVVDTFFRFKYDTNNEVWYFGHSSYGKSNDDSPFKFEFTVDGQIISNFGPAYCFFFDNEKKTFDEQHEPKTDKWAFIVQFFGAFIINVQQSFHLAEIEYLQSK